jgi:hypothetical protein
MASAKKRRRTGGGGGEAESVSAAPVRAEPPRWLRALGPLAVALAGVAMFSWTWRTWADPVVDFGREIYTAWRLAEGDVLYRDLATLNGPLAPYWTSVWWRLHGGSVLGMVIANVALLAGVAALLYRLLAAVAGRLAAAAAGVVLMTLFAFLRLVPIGNFNWATPYSHDVTVGVAVGVAALACLLAWQRSGRILWLAATGMGVGLLVINKLETLLAGAAALVVGVGLTLLDRRFVAAARVKSVVVFVGAACLPPLVAVAWLAAAMPLSAAAAGAVGHLGAALALDATDLPFYQQGMGLDDPAGNFGAMLRAALAWVLVLAPAAGIALGVRRPLGNPPLVCGIVFAVTLVALAGTAGSDGWLQAARALPLWIGLLVAAALVEAARAWRRGDALDGVALRAALLMFALALLAKMPLNARIYHYGFALAMPATLMLVAALVGWAPVAITRRGGQGGIFAAAALGVFAAAIASYLVIARVQLERLDRTIGRGADAIRVHSAGALFGEAVEIVRERAKPGQTLAAYPEGALANHLTGLRNPTPYMAVIPLETRAYGEERVLGALKASPPDYLMLVHRDTSEAGARFFGRDYARSIGAWIQRDYRPVGLVGAMPFRDRFGVLVLERRVAGAQPSAPR